MGRQFGVMCFTLLLVGCGSTGGLRQGAEIAANGKAYATAMQTLADLAIERRIDFIANDLAQERSEAKGKKESLENRLAGAVRDGREYAAIIADFKKHTTLLWEYFDGLDKFIKEPVSEPFATAATELASGFESIGKSFESKNIKVSADQKTALGALAGAVATAYHGRTVAEQLRKDAEPIGLQIDLQGKALNKISESITFADELDANDHYKNKVLQPYLVDVGIDKKAQLPSDWRANLSLVVKSSVTRAELQTAASAAKKLRTSWRDFLAGELRVDDSLGDMKSLNAALGEAKKLHETRN